MKKTIKFIKKVLLLLPLGYLIWIIPIGFNFGDILFDLFAGSIISAIIIFYNIFDYESFSNIKSEDFLESNHTVTIENNHESIKKIEANINEINPIKVKQNQNIITYEIERKYINSVITISKSNNRIQVNIKNKYFDFLPDFASNYRKLQVLTN